MEYNMCSENSVTVKWNHKQMGGKIGGPSGRKSIRGEKRGKNTNRVQTKHYLHFENKTSKFLSNIQMNKVSLRSNVLNSNAVEK